MSVQSKPFRLPDPKSVSGPNDNDLVNCQPQAMSAIRHADFATLQAALARYGIEPNPGPVETINEEVIPA